MTFLHRRFYSKLFSGWFVASYVVVSLIVLYADVAGLSERLFSQLESSTKNERHEVKLMMTNLISRLVGIHQVHNTTLPQW